MQVYYYVTSGSFDAYVWQALQRKQEFIDQLLRGNLSERSIEDVGASAALTAAEAKALATGNPAILEVVRLDTRIRELSALETHHHDAARRMAWEIQTTGTAIEQAEARGQRLAEDLEVVRGALAWAGDAGAGVVVRGVVYRGDGHRKAAAAALEDALRPVRRSCLAQRGAPAEAEVGSCLGLALHARVRLDRDPAASAGGDGLSVTLWLQGRERYDVSYPPGAPEGCIASTQALAHPRHIEYVAVAQAAELERLRGRLEDLRLEAAKPFADADRLAALRQERAALVDALQLREQDSGPVLMEREETLAVTLER